MIGNFVTGWTTGRVKQAGCSGYRPSLATRFDVEHCITIGRLSRPVHRCGGRGGLLRMGMLQGHTGRVYGFRGSGVRCVGIVLRARVRGGIAVHRGTRVLSHDRLARWLHHGSVWVQTCVTQVHWGKWDSQPSWQGRWRRLWRTTCWAQLLRPSLAVWAHPPTSSVLAYLARRQWPAP